MLFQEKIDNQIYNFGFSGSAFCEKEMALIIAKVKNPKVLIIDAQPNAGIDDRLINNLPTFVETYRNVHPKTPILVASRIRYAMDNYDEEIINQDNKNRKFMEDFVEKQNITDKNIYYVDGHEVFKDNFSEATVDGTHPNDYGSIQLADFLFKRNKKIFIKETIMHTKYIAHRGYSSLETENTYQSFIKAAKEPLFYGMECDVQITSDGHFVVHHDDSTGRLANENLVITKNIIR